MLAGVVRIGLGIFFVYLFAICGRGSVGVAFEVPSEIGWRIEAKHTSYLCDGKIRARLQHHFGFCDDIFSDPIAYVNASYVVDSGTEIFSSQVLFCGIELCSACGFVVLDKILVEAICYLLDIRQRFEVSFYLFRTEMIKQSHEVIHLMSK